MTIHESTNKNGLRVPAIVRLGVTGHRWLDDEPRLQAGVRQVLTRLDEKLKTLKHTKHTFIIVSPLAEGADRLVAEEVLAWQVVEGVDKPSLEVVLPLPEEDYLQDFQSQESKDEFRTLLARAKSVQVLNGATTRTEAYEQVGQYVVDNCDVLIAIWDEKPAAGQGGTGEIVDYARNVGRFTFVINSENGMIKEETHEGRWLESLQDLDTFNGEQLSDHAISSAVETEYAFLAKHATQLGLEQFIKPLRDHLLPHFARADLLAQRYQFKYTRAGGAIYTLAALAVAVVTIQTLVFAHLHELLWLEVGAMVVIVTLLHLLRVRKWHRKWIDYRFLAERLRAALFLSVADVHAEPPKPPLYLASSYQADDWMVRAFTWIWNERSSRRSDGEVPLQSLKRFLRALWLEDQVSFYTKTSERHTRRYWWLERTGEILFWLTLAVAFIHAVGLGELILPAFSSHLNVLLISAAIIFPAVGAALAGIRSHREYLRNSERYGQMARQLSRISRQIESAQTLKKLSELLQEANELMLRENQDWRIVLRFQKLGTP